MIPKTIFKGEVSKVFQKIDQKEDPLSKHLIYHKYQIPFDMKETGKLVVEACTCETTTMHNAFNGKLIHNILTQKKELSAEDLTDIEPLFREISRIQFKFRKSEETEMKTLDGKLHQLVEKSFIQNVESLEYEIFNSYVKSFGFRLSTNSLLWKKIENYILKRILNNEAFPRKSILLLSKLIKGTPDFWNQIVNFMINQPSFFQNRKNQNFLSSFINKPDLLSPEFSQSLKNQIFTTEFFKSCNSTDFGYYLYLCTSPSLTKEFLVSKATVANSNFSENWEKEDFLKKEFSALSETSRSIISEVLNTKSCILSLGKGLRPSTGLIVEKKEESWGINLLKIYISHMIGKEIMEGKKQAKKNITETHPLLHLQPKVFAQIIKGLSRYSQDHSRVFWQYLQHLTLNNLKLNLPIYDLDSFILLTKAFVKPYAKFSSFWVQFSELLMLKINQNHNIQPKGKSINPNMVIVLTFSFAKMITYSQNQPLFDYLTQTLISTLHLQHFDIIPTLNALAYCRFDNPTFWKTIDQNSGEYFFNKNSPLYIKTTSDMSLITKCYMILQLYSENFCLNVIGFANNNIENVLIEQVNHILDYSHCVTNDLMKSKSLIEKPKESMKACDQNAFQIRNREKWEKLTKLKLLFINNWINSQTDLFASICKLNMGKIIAFDQDLEQADSFSNLTGSLLKIITQSLTRDNLKNCLQFIIQIRDDQEALAWILKKYSHEVELLQSKLETMLEEDGSLNFDLQMQLKDNIKSLKQETTS